MVIAVILIGGSGVRFGSETPKQFLQIEGKDIFVYTTEVFQNHPWVDSILLVYPKGWREHVAESCQRHGLTKVEHLVEGGSTRQESSCNAVKYISLQGYGNPMILEHDGDRVLVDSGVISDCIACCRENGNAWPGVMSTDYVVEGSLRGIVGNLRTAVKRDTLRTHTPCVFYLQDLLRIHQYAEDNDIDNIFGGFW